MSMYSIPENRDDISEENLVILDHLAKLAYLVNSTIDMSASGSLEEPYSTDELCFQFMVHLYNEDKARWSSIVVDMMSVESVKESDDE